MISNRLKRLELNLKKMGLSNRYIASKIIKESDDSGLRDGVRENVGFNHQSSYDTWDVSKNPNLIDSTKSMETTSTEELLSMFSSTFRDFTAEELEKLHPYLKSKGQLFAWICSFADKEYDDLSWSELTKDGIVNSDFSLGSITSEKEAIAAELENLKEASESIKELNKVIEEIQAEGIYDEKDGARVGVNLLDTSDGVLAASFVTEFVIQSGLVEKLGEGILNSSIMSSIDDRMSLSLSTSDSSDESFKAEQTIYSQNASSWQSILGSYQQSGADMYNASSYIGLNDLDYNVNLLLEDDIDPDQMDGGIYEDDLQIPIRDWLFENNIELDDEFIL